MQFDTIGVRAAEGDAGHGHHHVSDPFRVDCALATGLPAIADTPARTGTRRCGASSRDGSVAWPDRPQRPS